MSASAPPTIPPRPVRAEQAAAAGANKLPEIPPRPVNKRLDRSVSPGFARSPINESPFYSNRRRSIEPQDASESAPRPPSIAQIPGIGQEGMEYAEQQDPDQGIDTAAQTRNIGKDLKLHAPKPSLPKSSATAQVQGVTRTDSAQATTHGIGQQDEMEPAYRVRSRASFTRPDSTASNERRRSSVVYQDEQGPAEIGIRVPINPLLGDVQAPSPAPFSPHHTGQNGEKKKHHSRTKSGREVVPPPGSYGLHGHGLAPQDKFEKDWYAKHPEQLKEEETHGHGVYEAIGSGRGSFALSSDDLNKIVHGTPRRSTVHTGVVDSYPDEQIGYIASENYTKSQLGTPLIGKADEGLPQVPESPLRKASTATGVPEIRKGLASISGRSDDDSEAIHIDQPAQKYNKVTGGEETMHETRGLKSPRHSSIEPDMIDENEHSHPILAYDEVQKDTNGEHLVPAITPRYERRSSRESEDYRGTGDLTPGSRPSSRPGSIYGLHSASHSLSRFISHGHDERDHTPLENVDEYEPLFPEDETDKKAQSHLERFKSRPGGLNQRFPSQDIWEDTPSSAMYEAIVSTPDLVSQEEKLKQNTYFEHPDAEAARKGEPSEDEKKKLIPSEERLAKSKFAPHLRGDMPARPGLTPRFPSQDIWEDSPDSHQLVTTVNQEEEESSAVDAKSPVDVAKPTIPPRPTKVAGEASVPPNVPARPPKRLHMVPPADAKLVDTAKAKDTSPTELKKVPSIPDRPKPQIPPRPGQKTSNEALTRTISPPSDASSETTVTSPPVSSKPQVPARPAASNIANLRGNFMADLNQKLGLGKPKEKEKAPEPVPEIEQEAKPVEDVRKGRARGPQRRARAKSPSSVTPAKLPARFTMFTAQSMWSIDDEGSLGVKSHDEKVKGNEPQISEESTAVETSAPEDSSKAEPHTADAEPPAAAPATLAKNTTDDDVDLINSEEEDATMSKHTTASSATATSGLDLERTAADPEKDVIPMSQHTTASNVGGATLEPSETKAPEEPIQLRNEQVNAPDPTSDSNESTDPNTSISTTNPTPSDSSFNENKPAPDSEDVATGADAPKEPMDESDVSYNRLEEMTAAADGKVSSSEELSDPIGC